MSKKEDIFYEEIEAKLEEMKQQPRQEEKESTGAKLNRVFSILLGLVIVMGLVITILGLLR